MSADPPEPADSTTASVARVYDYLLGGKDHFEVDRAWARAIMERDPHIDVTAKLNKALGRRMVDYLVHQGIRQFIDLGSGIPTSPPSVHDTARATDASARVIYVDHDPVVARHNEALRAVGEGLGVIQEDFLDIAGVFDTELFVSTIDLGQPVAVLCFSVFQNTPSGRVLEALSQLRSRIVPGSYLAISHVSDRTIQGVQDEITAQAEAGVYPYMYFRTDEQISEFFAGTELVDPGLVDFRDWRPSAAEIDHRPDLDSPFTAALGRYIG